MHLRPESENAKTNNTVFGVIPGIILTVWFVSAHLWTLQRRPWMNGSFVLAASCGALVRECEQGEKTTFGNIHSPASPWTVAEASAGFVRSRRRRSLRSDIGLCQRSGVTSGGEEKKGNNVRISGVQNCTSHTWQKSLLDKLRTLWRETAAHFPFSSKKKAKWSVKLYISFV